MQDRSAQVAANLDPLQAQTSISAITLTDLGGAVLNISASQLTNDAAAIAKITNPDCTISVTDTAANIEALGADLSDYPSVTSLNVVDICANFLNSDIYGLPLLSSVSIVDSVANIENDADEICATRLVTSIQLTDGVTAPLTLTSEQAYFYGIPNLVANSQFSLIVSDSTDGVAPYFDRLQSIEFTDLGTPVLNLKSTQALNDTTALAKISGDYTLQILDGVDNVSANLDALNADGQISAIAFWGFSTTLNLSASSAADDSVALGKIVGPYSIDVTDTAQNVLANISGLSGTPNITSVSVQDFVQNILADRDSLNSDQEITSVNVVADAKDVADNVTALGDVSRLSSIEISDNVADSLANQNAFGALTPLVSETVVDTAANVSANFDALAADPLVERIELSDAAPLTLSTAQVVAGSR